MRIEAVGIVLQKFPQTNLSDLSLSLAGGRCMSGAKPADMQRMAMAGLPSSQPPEIPATKAPRRTAHGPHRTGCSANASEIPCFSYRGSKLDNVRRTHWLLISPTCAHKKTEDVWRLNGFQRSIRYYSIVAANLWLTWACSFEGLARSSQKLQWQSSATKGCTPNAAMLQSTCTTHDTNRCDSSAKYFKCSTKNLHILFLNPSWTSNDVASFNDSDSGEL